MVDTRSTRGSGSLQSLNAGGERALRRRLGVGRKARGTPRKARSTPRSSGSCASERALIEKLRLVIKRMGRRDRAPGDNYSTINLFSPDTVPQPHVWLGGQPAPRLSPEAQWAHAQTGRLVRRSPPSLSPSLSPSPSPSRSPSRSPPSLRTVLNAVTAEYERLHPGASSSPPPPELRAALDAVTAQYRRNFQ
jgi:hypothetical protein